MKRTLFLYGTLQVPWPVYRYSFLLLLLFVAVVSVGSAQGVKVVFISAPSGNNTAAAPFSTQPVVEVQDAGGNRVYTSATVMISIATNGGTFTSGTLSGVTTMTTANGRATFSGLSIDKVGSYTLTVNSAGMAGSTTGSFTIVAGAPYRLSFYTEPGNGVAGSVLAWQPVVQVLDVGGNHVSTNINTSVTLSVITGPGGISSISQNPVNIFAGFANFSGLVFNAAGCYTIQASTSGLVSATSGTFCIAPGTASVTHSTVSAEPNTVSIGGSTSAVTVQLRDALGNNISDANDCLRLFVTSGPGSVSQIPVYVGSGRWSGIYTSSGTPGQVAVSAFLKPDGQPDCTFPGAGYQTIADTAQINVVAGTLSITAFEDRNWDGAQNENEEGQSNWQFRIYREGVVVATVTTGTYGVATVDVAVGIYTVCEVTQAGWVPTTSACVTVSISPGTTTNVVFGHTNTGKLCIEKFFDENGNGIQDSTEELLSGWVFSITDAVGNSTTAVTGDDGKVCIPLTSGTYTVCEILPLTGCAPVTSQCLTVQIATYTSALLQFGNANQPMVGFAWIEKLEDLNCNGQPDMGEPLIPGWRFHIKHIDSGHLWEQATGQNGRFGLWLPAGDYEVSEVALPGWQLVTPAIRKFTIVPGQPPVVIGFANSRTGLVCGKKYHDFNGNGQQDPAEGGIRDWEIQLIDENNQIAARGRTNDVGNYCIIARPGVYKLREVQQNGWKPIQPANGEYKTITISICGHLENYNFGNQRIMGRIKPKAYQEGPLYASCNGTHDPGEPALANWQFEIYQEGVLIETVTTDADGIATVEVSTGTYTICEVLQPGWQPTTPLCTTLTISTDATVDLVFGNASTGTLCIQKFHDQNSNGTQDMGEPGLSGWTFMISNGITTIPVTTGTTGTACAAVSAGNWTICEVTQAGWQPTTYSCTSVTLSVCETVTVVFGNTTTGSASGLIMPGRDTETERMTITGPDHSRAVTGTGEPEQWGDPQLTSIPNPTSGETTISYRLDRPAGIRLELYNMVGQYLATIDEGQRSTGLHSVPLDMQELPPGAYHLRLTVDNRVYTLMLMSNR